MLKIFQSQFASIHWNRLKSKFVNIISAFLIAKGLRGVSEENQHECSIRCPHDRSLPPTRRWNSNDSPNRPDVVPTNEFRGDGKILVWSLAGRSSRVPVEDRGREFAVETASNHPRNLTLCSRR